MVGGSTPTWGCRKYYLLSPQPDSGGCELLVILFSPTPSSPSSPALGLYSLQCANDGDSHANGAPSPPRELHFSGANANANVNVNANVNANANANANISVSVGRYGHPGTQRHLTGGPRFVRKQEGDTLRPMVFAEYITSRVMSPTKCVHMHARV